MGSPARFCAPPSMVWSKVAHPRCRTCPVLIPVALPARAERTAHPVALQRAAAWRMLNRITPLLVKEGLGVVDWDATRPPTTPCPLLPLRRGVVLSVDSMILGLTTIHENTRSALECGSSSYRLACLPHEPKAVAAATALQGAFGTSRKQGQIPRYARNDNQRLSDSSPESWWTRLRLPC
jgi:hypothetical protein